MTTAHCGSSTASADSRSAARRRARRRRPRARRSRRCAGRFGVIPRTLWWRLQPLLRAADVTARTRSRSSPAPWRGGTSSLRRGLRRSGRATMRATSASRSSGNARLPDVLRALPRREKLPMSMLARMTAQVQTPVPAGQEHVVIGWPIEFDGRKHHAGSAVLSSGGRGPRGRPSSADRSAGRLAPRRVCRAASLVAPQGRAAVTAPHLSAPPRSRKPAPQRR